MACGVALKRPLDLDGHLSPDTSIKRPRTTTAHCSPFRPTFFNTAASLGSRSQENSAASPANATSTFRSPFQSSSNTQLTPQQLESYLRAEIRSLRRRQLIPKRRAESKSSSAYRAPSSPGSHSSDSDGEVGGSCPGKQTRDSSSQHDKQFTFTQVQMICERLLKEQESRLRLEFENVLTQRLADQHETFIRFTQDQIHRKMENSDHLSYLS